MVQPAALRSGFAIILYIGKVCWFILGSRGLYPKAYGSVLGRGPEGTQPARGILELLLCDTRLEPNIVPDIDVFDIEVQQLQYQR